MKFNKLFLICMIICLFMISCNTSSDQVKYFKENPEAPIWLYCRVNDQLNDETRLYICDDVSRKNSRISLNLVVRVKDDKVDSIALETVAFDPNGILIETRPTYRQLDSILRSIDLKRIYSLNQNELGRYSARLQMEQFCDGYVKIIDLSMPK